MACTSHKFPGHCTGARIDSIYKQVERGKVERGTYKRKGVEYREEEGKKEGEKGLRNMDRQMDWTG